MKTAVDVSEERLEAARKILKTFAIRDTVDASLACVIRQHELRSLADALGSIDLDLTPEGLRRHRARRASGVSR